MIGSRFEQFSFQTKAASLAKNQWARPDSNRRPPPCEVSFTNLEPVLPYLCSDCLGANVSQGCETQASEGNFLRGLLSTNRRQ